MVTYAGGYARKIEDTVTIHCNTVLAAKEIFAAKRLTRSLDRPCSRTNDMLDGMNVSPSNLSHSELYGLILNSVSPPADCWVSTR